MKSKTKILVTGGAGFIGSVMVPNLLRKGFTVTVLDNFIFRQNSLMDVCWHPELRIVTGDVRDSVLMKQEISRHDVLIPLAAIVGAPACKRDPELTNQVNLESIRALADLTSTDQFVLFPVTNSGYGIGEGDIHCDETTPLNPISHYGRSKVDAEKYLLDNGNAITFRLATVFGSAPRMRMDLLVNDFVYRAYKDRFIVLFESHFKRNYIHIRDIADVFLHGLEKYDEMKGEPYNVGLSEANLSKLELCENIKKHLPDFHIFESEIAKDPDQRDYIVSNVKIESTGWKPQFSLDDGIKELIQCYSFLSINPYLNS